MRFSNVVIDSIATLEPTENLTSDALEKLLEPVYSRLALPSRLIESLTGVVSRRLWAPHTLLEDSAAAVAKTCVQQSTLITQKGKQVLGLVINCAVSKVLVEPSYASMVHQSLELDENCDNFDLSNACLGFMHAMRVAAEAIESGRISAALVVAAEDSRSVIENTIRHLNDSCHDIDTFRRSLPTLTLGSGAAAMILTHQKLAPHGHSLIGSVQRSHTAYARACRGTMEWMDTDVVTLLNQGVALASKTFQVATEEMKWSVEALTSYVCHQVGAAHVTLMAKTLGVPLERTPLTYPQYGNMGPVAVPFTLMHRHGKQPFNKGERIALMGIGSGLNCQMMELRW